MDSPSTSRLNGPDLLQAGSRVGGPSKEGAASRTGSAAQTRPRSLLEDITSEFERTQVQNELSSELFGFAPLSFTSRVVDSANEVIYDVVDKIEVEVMKRWGSALPTGAEQEQGEDRAVLLQKRADKVQKVGVGAGSSEAGRWMKASWLAAQSAHCARDYNSTAPDPD